MANYKINITTDIPTNIEVAMTSFSSVTVVGGIPPYTVTDKIGRAHV